MPDSSAQESRPWFFRPDGAPPLVIAHRGGAGLAPENTMAAFRNAIGLGVDGIELDLQRTADGCPLVFHDESLDRLTQAHGRVDTWRQEDLRFSVRVAGTEPLPLLHEVLAALASEPIKLFVEIKAPAVTGETLRLLMNAGFAPRAVVGSFDRRVVATIHEQAVLPAIQLVRSRDIPALLQESGIFARANSTPGFAVAGLAVADISAEIVAALHQRGVAVWVWTANTPREIAAVLQSGADAIISDYPDRCRQAIGP